jgi:hypothetical protein
VGRKRLTLIGYLLVFLGAVGVALTGFASAGVTVVCSAGLAVFFFQLTDPDHFVNGGPSDGSDETD